MPKQRLQSFYAEKYEPLALRSRRPNTKRLYRTTLKMFGLFLGRPPTLHDLNDATVSAFAAYRLESGLSKYSVNKDLFNLLAVWRWAHKKGHVTNWPDVEMEQPPERVPVALLREELTAVFAAARAERGSVDGIPGQLYWPAMFLVIWDSAERIGAVMGLTWDRVDLRRRWIRFEAEHRKGARADSLKAIAVDTAECLATFRRQRGPVFPWPYFPTHIYHRLAAIMERAGLPNNRLYKFHVLRKSVASHYEAAGGNASELLGHSSRKVTKAYLDPRIVKTPSAVDLLFRPE